MKTKAAHPGGAIETGLNAEQAQAAFEALFDHVPKIDTRTPSDIKAQKAAGALR